MLVASSLQHRVTFGCKARKVQGTQAAECHPLRCLAQGIVSLASELVGVYGQQLQILKAASGAPGIGQGACREEVELCGIKHIDVRARLHRAGACMHGIRALHRRPVSPFSSLTGSSLQAGRATGWVV